MKAIAPLLVGLAVTASLGCRSEVTSSSAVNSPTETQAQATPEPAPHDFGAFSFVIPDGWTVATPDANKTKAMLLLDGTNWQEAKAMLKVDVGAPAAESPRRLAELFAQNAGGTVQAEEINFDGATGVSVMTDSKTLEVPKHIVAIFHDGNAYLVMVGATEGTDVLSAMHTVLDTWKWTSPDGAPSGQP